MKKKKYYNILFLGDNVRKKDLLEQNTVLYNRLQTALEERDKYKKLYKENIEEINSLRRQLCEMEKQYTPTPPVTESESAVHGIFEDHPIKEEITAEVKLPDIMQYGAEVIGKIVLEGTKASNSFRDNPNEYSKDLINLVLGKTEVCKSAICEICAGDAEETEKQKNIDDVFKDATDYFQSLYKQV